MASASVTPDSMATKLNDTIDNITLFMKQESVFHNLADLERQIVLKFGKGEDLLPMEAQLLESAFELWKHSP